MKSSIVDLTRKLREILDSNSAPLNTDEQRKVEIGRIQAAQIIDALRMGEKSPDFLMSAFWLIQKQDNGMILRGFLAECQECLAEIAR